MKCKTPQPRMRPGRSRKKIQVIAVSPYLVHRAALRKCVVKFAASPLTKERADADATVRMPVAWRHFVTEKTGLMVTAHHHPRRYKTQLIT